MLKGSLTANLSRVLGSLLIYMSLSSTIALAQSNAQAVEIDSTNLGRQSFEPLAAYSWLFSSDISGWTPINMEGYTVTGGFVRLNPGSDPRMLSPNLNMQPSGVNYLKIGVRNRGGNSQGEVFFSASGWPAHQDRRALFTVPNDNSHHNLVARLDNIPNWWSPTIIDQIRIDPVQNGTGGLDSVIIDYIFLRYDLYPPIQPQITGVEPAGWTNGSITVEFASTDPADLANPAGPDQFGSGIADFRYRVDPLQDAVTYPYWADEWNGWSLGSVTYAPDQLAQGANRFHVYCFDRIGRVSSDNQVWLYFDSQPPTLPGVIAVDPVENNANSFAFGWGASFDPHSGLAGYYWRVNGGAETFTPDNYLPIGAYATVQGMNTLSVRAVDNLGQSSGSRSVTFMFDSVPPSQPSNVSVTPSVGYSNNFSFSWGPSSDATSGLDGYVWGINGTGSYFTTQLSVPAGTQPNVVEGNNNFHIVAVDNVGNLSTAVSVPFQYYIPRITTNTDTLKFTAYQNGSLPGPLNIHIQNGGTGTLDWSVSDDADWLSVTPSSGQSNSQLVEVAVTSSTIPVGTSTAIITISSSNAVNSPKTVIVQYEMFPESKVRLDSVRVTLGRSSPEIFPPDSIMPVPFGASLEVFGATLDKSGRSIASVPIEVFDGISYISGSKSDGLSVITSDENGQFNYTATQAIQNPPVGTFYPYWFACGDNALPILIPHLGSCNSADCFLDSVIASSKELRDASDSTVIGIIDDPAVVRLYPNYPPNPEDLTDTLNSSFFAGFAQFYSGPIERAYLSEGDSSWLLAGLEHIEKSNDSIAAALYDLQASESPVSGTFYVKLDGTWRLMSQRDANKFNWRKVDWLGVGIGVVTCAAGAATGLGAIPACGPLAVTVIKEYTKQTALPWACGYTGPNSAQTCNEVGGLVLDAAAVAVTMKIPSTSSASFARVMANFRMSKNFVKGARWTYEALRQVGRYRGLYNLSNSYSGFFHRHPFRERADSLISAVYIEGAVLTDTAAGLLDSLEFRAAISSTYGTEMGISAALTGQKAGDELTITLIPKRAIVDEGTSIPLAPTLAIENVSGTSEYAWSQVDHDSMVYIVSIPLLDLPGYREGQPYSAMITAAGFDIFSNQSLQSEATGFGQCGTQGIDLRFQGLGIRIAPGSVTTPVQVMVAPLPVDTCQECRGIYADDDTLAFLSTNAMAVDPRDLELSTSATVSLPIDTPLLTDYLAAGLKLTVGRQSLDGRTWEYLPSSLDNNLGLISAPTNRLGVFAVFISTTRSYLCGDTDGSSFVTISDAVFLINYIFSGGPSPNPTPAGDADCSGIVTISDAVYLINFIFSGGPAPCVACP